MITDEMRQAILGMHEKGMKIRQISRGLGISRNTVRMVLKGGIPEEKAPGTSFEDELPLIREVFLNAKETWCESKRRLRIGESPSDTVP